MSQITIRGLGTASDAELRANILADFEEYPSEGTGFDKLAQEYIGKTGVTPKGGKGFIGKSLDMLKTAVTPNSSTEPLSVPDGAPLPPLSQYAEQDDGTTWYVAAGIAALAIGGIMYMRGR